MKANVLQLEGLRCLVLDADGPLVRSAEDARTLIEEAMNERAPVIVVPVSRLDSAFFELRTGVAGDVLQKVINYGFKFAVVGDVSGSASASDALRDFITESNRGRSILFVPDLPALAERLAPPHAPPG